MAKSSPMLFEFNDYSFGIDWTTNPLRVTIPYLVDAKNFNLTAFKGLEKRAGCTKLCTSSVDDVGTNPVHTLYEYKSPDGNNYLIAGCGTILAILDTALDQWAELKDGLTDGVRWSCATHNGYCIAVNGTDDNLKIYAGTAVPMGSYGVGIVAPSVAPACTIAGTGITGSYKYVFTYAQTKVGSVTAESNPSPVSALVSPANDTVTVTGDLCYDINVDTIRLYRSLNLAPGDEDPTQFFRVAEFANTVPTTTALTIAFVGSGLDDLTGAANTIDTTTNIRVKITKASAGGTCSDVFSGTGNDDLYDVVSESTTLTGATSIKIRIKAIHQAKTGAIPYSDTWEASFDNGNTYYSYPTNCNTRWCGKNNIITNPSTGKKTSFKFAAYLGHVKDDVWTITYSSVDKYRASDVDELDNDGNLIWGAETDCIAGTNTWGNTTWTFGAATGHTAGDYWNIQRTTASHWTFADDLEDNELTTLCQINNTPPPKSKYCCLHKDRMIYANCPDEEYGESLFVFSKLSIPDAVPSTNYQYFDKEDGNAITGIASLPDYLVIFKKNKIAVMEGDFQQWYVISQGIGNIAPHGIIVVGDKAFFVSEEGFKATDGRVVYNVGKRLWALNKAQYFTESAAANYTASYFPINYQIKFNLYHASFNNIVMCGHELSNLYSEISLEQKMEDLYVGWTYHEYDNHSFYTIGSYTNSSGITKVVAGSATGYVYELDYGAHDDPTYDIAVSMETGLLTLGVPKHLVKTVRGVNVSYTSDVTDGNGTVKLYYDTSDTRGSDYVTLDGGGAAYQSYGFSNSNYYGPDGQITENLDFVDSMDGRMFRFRLTDTSHNRFSLIEIAPYFRVEGRR